MVCFDLIKSKPFLGSFVSCVLGIPTAVYLIMQGLTHNLEHQIFGDYIPFIVLLTALFVITGGIHLSGDIQAKPIINTLFLGIGYVLASFTGTTGAAMLLIRPVIETNSQRSRSSQLWRFTLPSWGSTPLIIIFKRC